ncbi:MAG: AmmeMemoRadiSam system radical SAM enzyme [Armatimonadetes bacterium]|nr:AmmeMemoRadiSam system radical SAM enzyme [Armatimonadota bacterium]
MIAERSHGMDRREFVRQCMLGCGAAVGGPALRAAEQAGLLARAAIAGPTSNQPGLFWKSGTGTNTICLICPRKCEIGIGERGFCGVRENRDARYITLVYGYPAVVRADPMEKGPFFHFLPGTKSIALGTAGCNLDCKYCQSWEFAQARPEHTDNKYLPPDSLVEQTKKLGLPSITFTFSEPLMCIEYILDASKAARKAGLSVLAHTAAFACEDAIRALCQACDAVNIDLKGFTQEFYKNITGGNLDTVLDAILVASSTGTWLELTHLVVPGYNDNVADFRRMCAWIKENLGPNVPLHVSRFFPAYKLRNVPPTPIDTLKVLRRTAYEVGLNYVYFGNLGGDPGESTYCPCCGVRLINRVGYKIQIEGLNLATGKCRKCGLKIPGVWR